MSEVYATSHVDLQICVVMVGLPARGKTYIAEKGVVLHIGVTMLSD